MKLLVFSTEASIKIEPNLILRGNLLPTEAKNLSKKAQSEFLRDVKVNMVSTAELYAGKLCAALDRQHPRDLFDIKPVLHQKIKYSR